MKENMVIKNKQIGNLREKQNYKEEANRNYTTNNHNTRRKILLDRSHGRTEVAGKEVSINLKRNQHK